jgi:DNA-binding NarL/FixJ family response regulator
MNLAERAYPIQRNAAEPATDLDAEAPVSSSQRRVEMESGVPLPLAALAVGEALVTDEQRFWTGLLSGTIAWERGQAAESIWRELITGRSKLLVGERTETSTFLLIRAVEPENQPCQALSPRKLRLLEAAAAAERGKNLAFELGTSAAAVSGGLAVCLSRIGLRSRAELLWFCRDRGELAPPRSLRAARLRTKRGEFAVIGFARRAVEVEGPFTRVERQIVLGVLSGMSNREIARSRNVSICTVQNQVASALKRARVASRYELVARSTDWARSAPAPDRVPPSVVRRFSELTARPVASR